MNRDEFILGAIIQYAKADTAEERTEIYNSTMAVLRASGGAQPSEKE